MTTSVCVAWSRRLFLSTLGALGLLYLTLLVWGPELLNHDELNYLYEGLRLLSERRLASYLHGPVLYELAAALETTGYLAARLLGQVTTPLEYTVQMLLHLPAHMRALHFLAACAGVGTVVLTYRLGLLFGGEMVGALSALLCASNLTFIAMTSIYKEEGFYWFLMLLAMERAWAAAAGGRRRDAVLAGAAIGAAFATKYLAIVAGLLVFLPFVLASRTGRRRAAGLGVAMAASALAAILLLYPFLLTDTGNVFRSIRRLDSSYAAIGSDLAIKTYLRYHLVNLVGGIIPCLGVIELIRRAAREPRGPVLLALVPLSLLFLIGLRPGFSLAYYAFPLAVMLCVLAASLAVHLTTTALLRPVKYLPVLVLALVAASDNAFLLGTVKYSLHLTGPRTRLLAQEIVQARARPGDCVLINMAIGGENIFGPPLVPNNTPPGRGLFTRALAVANEKRAGPKYELRLIEASERVSDEDAAGCHWLVLGHMGPRSHVEYGKTEAMLDERVQAPGGFTRLASVTAFPEVHSIWTPLLTTSEYDDIRKTSIADYLGKRALGLNFVIYQRLRE